MIALLGLPWDASSSSQRGPAQAPPHIRRALWASSSNAWSERGYDLAAPGVLEDAGDLPLPDDPAAAREAIEQAVSRLLGQGRTPFILGGDHSVSYPVLRAVAGGGEPPTVLHFDAHADLYECFPLTDGPGGERPDPYSHACPFTRIMEEGLATRLIQIGLRTLNAHQRQQAARFGVEQFGADRWREALPLLASLSGPVYVSLDIDVVEPMLAPGVSHPEPGGLSVRDVLDLIAAIRARLVGADLVEYNPENDVRDLTARVAAKFLKELVGLWLEFGGTGAAGGGGGAGAPPPPPPAPGEEVKHKKGKKK
ncbi:MAG: agmatinase family protein, partial [Acidobacteriota bacterium]